MSDPHFSFIAISYGFYLICMGGLTAALVIGRYKAKRRVEALTQQLPNKGN